MDIAEKELIFNERIENILGEYVIKNKTSILSTKNTYSDFEDIKQELIFYCFSKLEQFDCEKENFEQFCERVFDEKLQDLKIKNKKENSHINMGNDINLLNLEM